MNPQENPSSEPYILATHWRDNPFARPAPLGCGVEYVMACGIDDRLSMVRHFDADECRRALRVLPLQLTVRKAVSRRLKRLSASSAFTLLELLCVISVIAILLAMAVPSVARAYRATAARAAWVEFWHSAQIVAMSADVLPPSMDPALMPPDEAWAQTYQMIGSTPRYADVSWETIRMLRESTAILGRPVNTKGTP